MFLSSLASATAFKIAARDFSAIGTDAYSVGHICWDGDFEWFQWSGKVFRAHRTDTIDLRTGNRIGRFECKVSEVAAYPQCFSHLGDQFVELCKQGKGNLIGC